MLNLNPTYLMLSLVFSSIGLGFFIYGKKQKKRIPYWTGIALMIYPYFVHDPALMTLAGLILMAIPWCINKLRGY